MKKFEHAQGNRDLYMWETGPYTEGCPCTIRGRGTGQGWGPVHGDPPTSQNGRLGDGNNHFTEVYVELIAQYMNTTCRAISWTEIISFAVSPAVVVN